MTKRWVIVLLLSLLAVLRSAAGFADDKGQRFRISAISATDGSITVTLTAGDAIKMRDVFIIVHKGVPIGESMVIAIKEGKSATLLPKATKSAPQVGDELSFARHAEAPPDDGTKNWTKFESQEGNFSVSVPSAFDPPTKSQHTTAIGPMTELEYITLDRADHMIYSVIVQNYSFTRREGYHVAGDDLQLEYMVEELSKQFKVRWKRELTIENHSARELEMEQGGATGRIRVVIIENLMYQLMAISSTQRGISDRAYKFLNSFKQLKKS